MKSLLKLGLLRIGVLVRYSLITSKDYLASVVHVSIEPFFNMLFKSLINSAKLERNLLRKNILPKNACNYLMFIGWLMFRIAYILVGWILMPSFEVMCPRSFPSYNPKSDFLGFKDMSNFLHFMYILLIWSRCSLSDLENTMISFK